MTPTRINMTVLEKWWAETFKPRKKNVGLSIILRSLNKKKGHRFTDKRMDRGVQRAIELKQRQKRLNFIRTGSAQAFERALALHNAKLIHIQN